MPPSGAPLNIIPYCLKFSVLPKSFTGLGRWSVLQDTSCSSSTSVLPSAHLRWLPPISSPRIQCLHSCTQTHMQPHAFRIKNNKNLKNFWTFTATIKGFGWVQTEICFGAKCQSIFLMSVFCQRNLKNPLTAAGDMAQPIKALARRSGNLNRSQVKVEGEN